MADGILEALFGLEFGHADVADDADFLQLIYHPSRFTGKKTGKLLIAIGIACVTDERFCGILLVRSKFFGMTF